MLKRLTFLALVAILNTEVSFAEDPVMAIFERGQSIFTSKARDRLTVENFCKAAEVIHIVLNLELPKRYTPKTNGKGKKTNSITCYPGVRPTTKAENTSGFIDYLKSFYLIAVLLVEDMYLGHQNNFTEADQAQFDAAKEYYDLRNLKSKVSKAVKNKKHDKLMRAHLTVALEIYEQTANSLVENPHKIAEYFSEQREQQIKACLDDSTDSKGFSPSTQQALTGYSMYLGVLSSLNPWIGKQSRKLTPYFIWFNSIYDVFKKASKALTLGKKLNIIIPKDHAPHPDIAKADIKRFKNHYKSKSHINVMLLSNSELDELEQNIAPNRKKVSKSSRQAVAQRRESPDSILEVTTEKSVL